MIKISIATGLGVGLLNGVVGRAALRWALDKSEKTFYGVWVAGFLYRLLFFVAAFAVVAATKVLALVPAMLSLLAGQLLIGVVPLKKARFGIDVDQGGARAELASSTPLISTERTGHGF